MMKYFLFDAACWSVGIFNTIGEGRISDWLHMILWPPVVVILFLVLLIIICSIFGCKYTCCIRPPEDVVMMADRLEELGICTLDDINPEERERMLRDLATTSTKVVDCNNDPQPTTPQPDDHNASGV